MRRNRPAVDWPRLREVVVRRDLTQMMWAYVEDHLRLPPPTWKPIVCVAPIVDHDCGPCSGRTTLDHVKPEPRMGVKADDVPEQLVSVCEGHSEAGMKAGHQWNTAHRAEERAYLRKIYEET